MHFAVDRIEDRVAVLQDDDGHSVPVDIGLLPLDVAAGDVLQYVNGRYEHDRQETESRRDRIYCLEQLLRGKRKEAD